MQHMMLFGTSTAPAPARPVYSCKYDRRYAGNMIRRGVVFCTLYWNDTRHEILPQNQLEEGTNNYIVTTLIHSPCFYTARGSKWGVWDVSAWPFLLLLRGRGCDLGEQKSCQPDVCV